MAFRTRVALTRLSFIRLVPMPLVNLLHPEAEFFGKFLHVPLVPVLPFLEFGLQSTNLAPRLLLLLPDDVTVVVVVLFGADVKSVEDDEVVAFLSDLVGDDLLQLEEIGLVVNEGDDSRGQVVQIVLDFPSFAAGAFVSRPRLLLVSVLVNVVRSRLVVVVVVEAI